jgi:hypothetical protein
MQIIAWKCEQLVEFLRARQSISLIRNIEQIADEDFA